MMNAEINKQMKLSQHFTLGELCKTSVKTADGNIPSHVHIENLKRLTGWLETLCDEWNRRYGSLTPNPGLTPNPSPKGEGNFDDPIIERSAKSIWVHFAVRPEGNRRRVEMIVKR